MIMIKLRLCFTADQLLLGVVKNNANKNPNYNANESFIIRSSIKRLTY